MRKADLRAFCRGPSELADGATRGSGAHLKFATRQLLLQLWQDTLQLVQGGNGPRQPAVQAGDAGAMTDARTPSA